MEQKALIVETLKAQPIFKNCELPELELMAASVTSQPRLHPGDVLCEQGDPADRWWIVVSGSAAVRVDGIDIGAIAVGDTVGELGLLDNEPRSASVIASSEMSLIEIDDDHFLDALRESSELGITMLREAARRLRS
jgi:CRP-like cAMP-binding protein